LLDGPLGWFTGPASKTLLSADKIAEACAVPTVPILVVAGTKSRDIKNPASWFSRSAMDGPNDGTVTVVETRLNAGEQSVTIDESHTRLPENSKAIEAARRFINEGIRPLEPDAPALQAVTRDEQAIEKALAQKAPLPNVAIKTLGGNVYWADLICADGWRVQQHVATGNCRILDPKNTRRAWGEKERVLKTFDALCLSQAN
jgi:hypothetical protein